MGCKLPSEKDAWRLGCRCSQGQGLHLPPVMPGVETRLPLRKSTEHRAAAVNVFRLKGGQEDGQPQPKRSQRGPAHSSG